MPAEPLKDSLAYQHYGGEGPKKLAERQAIQLVDQQLGEARQERLRAAVHHGNPEKAPEERLRAAEVAGCPAAGGYRTKLKGQNQAAERYRKMEAGHNQGVDIH